MTLRARWVMLRARWVTLRARWVTPLFLQRLHARLRCEATGAAAAAACMQLLAAAGEPSDTIQVRCSDGKGRESSR